MINKKTNSSHNRTQHITDARRQEEIARQVNQLPHFNINSPEFQDLQKTNPCAALLHMISQILYIGIAEDNPEYVEKARASLLKEVASLAQISSQPNFRLSKTQISNFYGVCDSQSLIFMQWKTSGNNDCLLRAYYKYKIQDFIVPIIDSISVTMAIADKRVIFLNHEFAITYGVSKFESKKIVPGELFISVMDSTSLWSFDKDDAVRVKIDTLRAAKKAITNWRGANIAGEVTHEEAQRIADFLGLIPVPDSKRTLVMLKSKGLQKGFNSKSVAV